MNVPRHKAFADLQPARVVVLLALVAVGAFLAEHVRPGHHMHVGPDGPRHHHHAFVGVHDHNADTTAAMAHAHDDATPSDEGATPETPPEAPDFQALLTASALMTPSAPLSFTVLMTLVVASSTAQRSTPRQRRTIRTAGPRAPPR